VFGGGGHVKSVPCRCHVTSDWPIGWYLYGCIEQVASLTDLSKAALAMADKN
jgi:hypothetical protein